jgi:hypothetical protein
VKKEKEKFSYVPSKSFHVIAVVGPGTKCFRAALRKMNPQFCFPQADSVLPSEPPM